MRSALSIVAFSNATELEGTQALLETALAALDKAGRHLAAAYVDMAMMHLLSDADGADDRNFAAITELE